MHIYWKYQWHITKKRIPLLDLLINCVSGRSARQILSIKHGYTFLFLNFVIFDLCNSSANSWSDIFSFLIPLSTNLFCVAKFFDGAPVAEVFLI